MHRRTRSTLALAVALGALVAACTDPVATDVPEPGTSRTPADVAGPGLPVQPAVRALKGEREELAGTLRVEGDGCFTWADGPAEPRWVVWPPSATHDGARVRLGDGTLLGDGDRLEGAGFLGGAEVLPEWDVADSYFRTFGDFCGADERGVVVLDKVRRADD